MPRARLTALTRSYNRREEEFASAKAFNDYLEEVEDISAPLLALLSRAHTRRCSLQPKHAHRGCCDRGEAGGVRGRAQ